MATIPSVNNTVDYGGSNLFRFFHLSKPETLTSEVYIDHTVISAPLPTSGGSSASARMIGCSSAFAAALSSSMSSSDRQAAIQSVVASFIPFASAKDAIATHPAMYKLGVSISKNKDDDTLRSAELKTQTLERLSPAQETLLWDNLYYQALTSKSAKTTDTIIAMLRANNFANAIEMLPTVLETTEIDTAILHDIAQASVVIPSELVARPRVAAVATTPVVDNTTRTTLLKRSTADIARYESDELEAAIIEMQQADQVYTQQEARRHQAAVSDYDATVAAIRKAAEAVPVNLENPSPAAPGPEIPVFHYVALDPFATAFIVAHLSTGTRRLMSAYLKDTDKSYTAVINTMQSKQATLQQTVIANRVDPQRYFSYQGVTIPLTPLPMAGSYMLSSQPITGTESKHIVYLTQYHGTPSARMSKVSITATPTGGGTAITTVAQQSLAQSDSHTTYQLFADGLAADTEYTLTGSYEDDNGSSQRMASTTYTTGTATYKPATIPTKTSIPTTSFDDGEPGNEDTPMYGVSKIGIGDFLRVEQQVCCYVPGEVSHIENIMAREFKNKDTFELWRDENAKEESTDSESEKVKDTTSTDRHELHKEAARVIQEDKANQMGASAGVSASYMGLAIHAEGNLSATNSQSTTNNFSQAETYAREVVERAMERVVVKVSSKRSSRMIHEFTETNKHGFDNRAGDKHVTGIYRWVDKLVENKLVNYGKRLMYSFMVPEPAKNYKTWLAAKVYDGSHAKLIMPLKPIDPADLTKNAWIPANLDSSNYAILAAEYGAEVELYQIEGVHIGKTYSECPLLTGAKSKDDNKLHVGGYKYEFEIPKGYYCKEISYNFSVVDQDRHNEGMHGHLQIGTFMRSIYRSYYERGTKDSKQTHYAISGNNIDLYLCNNRINSVPDELPSQDYTNAYGRYVARVLPVSVNTFNVGSFALNVTALCMWHPSAKAEWQADTYQRITLAYHKKLKEYNEAMQAYNEAIAAQTNQDKAKKGAVNYSINPMEARATEQRELKRLCMELMLAPFGYYGSGYDMLGGDHYAAGAYNTANIVATDYYADATACARFMEEAFDWSIMAYMMYPYYWGSQADWQDLVTTTCAADYIFQAFLQSGMASVTLPVRPGYETDVLYFLDTGMIPVAKQLVTSTQDQKYGTVMQQLQLPKPKLIGEPWITRVPTSLTIIQTGSGPLVENGLPCVCTPTNDPLAKGDGLLTGATATIPSTTITQITDAVKEVVALIATLVAAPPATTGGSTPPAPRDCSGIQAQLVVLHGLLHAIQVANGAPGADRADIVLQLKELRAQVNAIALAAAGEGCPADELGLLVTNINNMIHGLRG
jgi:hypothetical protein